MANDYLRDGKPDRSPVTGEYNEFQLRALLSATSDVIYRMSADWRIMYQLSGRNFLANTGAGDSDWLYKYIHPDHRPQVSEAIARAIETRQPFELEHAVLRADGTLGWTFSRAVPILNEQGDIIEWFGTASDVTERRRAEERTKATSYNAEKLKRLYEAITGSTPDLMYVFNLNYQFIYANEALLTMWGQTWDTAIGKGLLELGYEPWHAEMHEREIDEVVRTKKPIRGEVSFPHAVLGRRVYDYIFVPVLNTEGDIEAVAGTTRDITEIKRAEDARNSLMAELEKRVEERTRELNRSNEDLQQFAHVASHDLKEPLRKIKTFASLLKEDQAMLSSDSANIYLSKIVSAADRMTNMVEGVLNYSKADELAGSMELIDLNSIINDVQIDLELAIQQKAGTIIKEDLPKIHGAKILIHQLFYNLLNNALKFAKADVPPIVHISCDMRNIDGQMFVNIIVSDNGIGFEPVYKDKVFELFSRLNAKDKYEGSGLGLSLCKKIVLRHGGTISARAVKGEGAEFLISLPVNQGMVS
jgi:PAS domain S-box-containing protein